MKKVIKLILILGILGIFLSKNVVQATGDSSHLLVEIWDKESKEYIPLKGKSIFNVLNFLPGDTEIEKIRITNYSDKPQTVALRVTNFNRGCNISNGKEYCLADRLILTITQLGAFSPSYSGSLTEFYNAGEVILSEVSGNGGQVEYNFSVYFEKKAKSKEYQGATTNFDLIIGFLSKETVSEEPASGGGGYITPLPGGVGQIIITGPPVLTATSAEIFCETRDNEGSYIPSWCRIIYDTQSHPFLVEGPPNYGYAFSTDPTPSPKTSTHEIILPGLQPNTTYYYRVVCWASPKKITKEYTFTTLSKKEKKSTFQKKSAFPSQKEFFEKKETPSSFFKNSFPSFESKSKEKVSQKLAKIKEEKKEKVLPKEVQQRKKVKTSKGSFSLREKLKEKGLLAEIQANLFNLKLILFIILIAIITFFVSRKIKKEKKKD